jgi:hypothetical protein
MNSLAMYFVCNNVIIDYKICCQNKRFVIKRYQYKKINVFWQDQNPISSTKIIIIINSTFA